MDENWLIVDVYTLFVENMRIYEDDICKQFTYSFFFLGFEYHVDVYTVPMLCAT